jgi:cytokinesis protein
LLKQHSAETPEELALLHPADRLMLRLIKIPHLSDRVTGMLYQVSFEETITLLEKVRWCLAVFGALSRSLNLAACVQGVILLQVACHDLRDAVQFKALLNVILMMGNYMNGSNYGGGAYGFKIASINRVCNLGVTTNMRLTSGCSFQNSWWIRKAQMGRIC